MDIRRYQIIMGWVLTGSLVALSGAQAADPSAPGVARIRSRAPSADIQQTRFSRRAAATPATATNNATTEAAATDSVDVVDGHCGYGFGDTTPWWFGSRQVGPLRWLLCDGYCTVSPSHGWVRPYKVPVRRIPVGYTRFYGEPRAVAGSAAPAIPAPPPMIYTATDTTQLGFYYQRVPQWRDQPHLYPPTPWPAHFHYRYCPQGRGCGPGGFGASYGTEVIVPAEEQPVSDGPVEASIEQLSPAAIR